MIDRARAAITQVIEHLAESFESRARQDTAEAAAYAETFAPSRRLEGRAEAYTDAARAVREQLAVLLGRDEPPTPVTPSERERLHTLIADCHALIDLDRDPALSARITAVLTPCDSAGHCVPPPDAGDDPPTDPPSSTGAR